MVIRLGYVSISMKLGKKVTASSTVTYKNYNKLLNHEKKMEKLKSIAISNLKDLETIIKYNIDENIHFYRITSFLIPLVTHPEVGYWGHREIFKRDFEYIGKMINNNNMRIDSHPNEFNVLNSTNEEVVKNTIENLSVQNEWFEDMNYNQGKMILHVGGAAGGKSEGIKRFISNYNKVPESTSSKIIIENDDKIYNVEDVLKICRAVKCPMVLDVHHHNCNNNGEDILLYLDKVFNTWNNEELIPKIHFSSPREFENDRRHSDYINPIEFINFLHKAKIIDRDFDVMLECKMKDEALFKLRDDLKRLKPEYKWCDESTFIV